MASSRRARCSDTKIIKPSSLFDNGWQLLAVTYCAKVAEVSSKNIIPIPVQENNVV